MIIRMDRPFANDHPDGLASCKCSSNSFSVILLLRKKHIFLLQIFSSFSYSMNLLPCNNIFPVSKFIPKFSFPVLFSSEKVYFPSPNIIYLFHFVFFSIKMNSFSKYHPPFPSMFILTSKDPKLKILESWGRILIIYLA